MHSVLNLTLEPCKLFEQSAECYPFSGRETEQLEFDMAHFTIHLAGARGNNNEM